MNRTIIFDINNIENSVFLPKNLQTFIYRDEQLLDQAGNAFGRVLDNILIQTSIFLLCMQNRSTYSVMFGCDIHPSRSSERPFCMT